MKNTKSFWAAIITIILASWASHASIATMAVVPFIILGVVLTKLFAYLEGEAVILHRIKE